MSGRQFAPLIAGVISIAVFATGCGSDATADGGCAKAVDEPLDPASGLHLLDPDTPVEYLTDPPTSGAHLTIGHPETGIRTEPLTPIAQVAQLETGVVLVQYGPTVDAEQQAELETLGSDLALVLPNPDLPAPVIATAWTKKLVCSDVSAATIGDVMADVAGFIDDNARAVVSVRHADGQDE